MLRGLLLSATLSIGLPAAGCGGSDGGTTPGGPGPWLGFREARAYPAGGSSVTSLVACDVTNDGVLDLVAVGRAEAVRVLPGTANGTFGAPSGPYAAGNDALRAAVGDVDGDGTQDLVVIGHFDNAFHVRRGLGGGQYGEAVRYSLRNHGRQLVVADLNGDHFDDVVAVHDGSGQPIWVSVFLGTAGGALRPTWELGTQYTTSREAVVGDFDADGRRDVAIGAADDRASLLVFRGLGTGELTAPLALPPAPVSTPGASDGTDGVAAADLNGDGRDDLVVAHSDPARVTVRIATASGFEGPRLLAAPPSAEVALADVDDDGRLDAVVSHFESGTISIFPGLGGGSFGAARAFPAGPAPTQLVVADFDRDGLPDVAVASAGDGQVRVLMNRGKQP